MVDYRAGIANTQEVSEYLVVSEDKKSVTHTHTHTHTPFVSLSGVCQRDTGGSQGQNKKQSKQCLITTQHVIQMAVSPSEDKGMTE